MSCHEVLDALESYIAGDLDDREASRVAGHLATCPACGVAYEETRLLVSELKDLRNALQPTRVFGEVPQMSTSVKQRERGPRRRSWGRAWTVAAAALVLALAGAVALITVPSLARTVPLPVGARLDDLQRENQAVQAQNQALQERVTKLEARVESLTGDEVTVVPTSEEDLPDEVTMAVQQVVIEFIKAQYAGDVRRLKSLSSPALQARIDEHPDEYLRDDAGAVSFAQITDVGVSEGLYVTFVRLSDTKVFSDSQYQEDFSVKRAGDRYLVETMEMDA
ncbi:MAG: zf-HC2 domain-containing protein [Thermoleophilia bacterium]